MENIDRKGKLYWDRKVPDTNLERFKKQLEDKYNVKFESYWQLHEWTVKNYSEFWEEMWHFFDIISSVPYKEVFVKTGPGFLDNEWFRGAKLNYAENILRKRDDSVALICLNELGYEETVTYAEMFEEVQMYAAAFRKNGLQIGDRVACFLPSRKEAIFAMLAVASIGGMWGGPVPFFGAKAASDIINMMEPKFLISIDSHQYNGVIYPTLDHLPVIVKSVPTLEKIILIVTEEKTRTKDLSDIHNCVVLEDFLVEGQAQDGSVPGIIFEQLPFDQPFNVCYTSGTTGLPKAAILSAGTVISLMRDFALSYDLKSGDIVCMNIQVGWNTWDYFIPCLGLGLPLFLYNGSISHVSDGENFWDLIGKYKVNMVYLVTAMVDKMEKMQIVPSPGTDLSSLKKVIIGASPVKMQNFEFLQANIKKDLFIGIIYDTSEVLGAFSGIDMNLPVYGGEIQVPSLGIDIKCFDSEGKAVIGRRGELVVCKPAVNFLTGLWKDDDKAKLTEIYLSKFPGVWTQFDECWINPKTNGIVVTGRSDDTLQQKGNRFGATDIYFAIHSIDELEDYICVSQQKFNGDSRAVLFAKMRKGYKLTPEIRAYIEKRINDELYENCVPELILEVPDIPYNQNDKRMESLVRKIIESNKIPEVMNIRNPECLKYYINIPEILSYNLS